mmetsp:Transcript_72168/g.121115  ORF Transcript_72168/g.121115 Transcript_72168/m.121115 type:complete len:284 (-) Transcript_72168:556-1407(-)
MRLPAVQSHSRSAANGQWPMAVRLERDHCPDPSLALALPKSHTAASADLDGDAKAAAAIKAIEAVHAECHVGGGFPPVKLCGQLQFDPGGLLQGLVGERHGDHNGHGPHTLPQGIVIQVQIEFRGAHPLQLHRQQIVVALEREALVPRGRVGPVLRLRGRLLVFVRHVDAVEVVGQVQPFTDHHRQFAPAPLRVLECRRVRPRRRVGTGGAPGAHRDQTESHGGPGPERWHRLCALGMRAGPIYRVLMAQEGTAIGHRDGVTLQRDFRGVSTNCEFGLAQEAF